ncbi:MAG TPA: VWA domain-containing protein, partial [Bryobacterales bacterium]|nr:VWA domain-containing protein [Bryobacterales bacterium]
MATRTRGWTAPAAICVALAAACSAGAQPQQPVLKVTTRLIQVHVIARTADGKPVANLTRDDFTLLDEGRQEPITFFTVETALPSSELPAPLPPNTFSNRLDRLAGATSVTAILFDGLNTPMTDQAYARRQIVRFLRELPENQKVALYALGRGLVVLQDFTSDAQSLIRALEAYQGDLSFAAEEAIGRGAPPGVIRFHGWLQELKLNLIEHYRKDRALRTIRSLEAIAHHVQRVPGRKNLIWVSGSFPVWIARDSVPLPRKPRPGPQRFRPEVERAARALNNANLAVYPVDARGL